MLQYGQMTLVVMLVTPEIAKEMLGLNNANRNVSSSYVQQYARAMLAGKWYPKPLAICFKADGSLGNGQHTLLAIIESGAPQELLIAYNCPDSTIAVMDRGKTRSMADIAHFLEVDLNSRRAGIAKIIEYGTDSGFVPSFDEIFDAYKKHEEQIEFVCGLHRRKPGFSNGAMAACAKAAYHLPQEVIRRFLNVVATGIPESPADVAAIRFLRNEERAKGGGSLRQKMSYAFAQSALRAFSEGRELASLRPAKTELFPVPAHD